MGSTVAEVTQKVVDLFKCSGIIMTAVIIDNGEILTGVGVIKIQLPLAFDCIRRCPIED